MNGSPVVFPPAANYMPPLPSGDFCGLPDVAPFLSTKLFLSEPVENLRFYFSPEAMKNIELVMRCKRVLCRIDDLVRFNNLYQHTCLILQAGSQATMRLTKFRSVRPEWNTLVEIPFCLHITKVGRCPRFLEADELELHEQWLLLLDEILRPMIGVEEKLIPFIAPHQTSRIPKDILAMKPRNFKFVSLPNEKPEENPPSASSGYNSS